VRPFCIITAGDPPGYKITFVAHVEVCRLVLCTASSSVISCWGSVLLLWPVLLRSVLGPVIGPSTPSEEVINLAEESSPLRLAKGNPDGDN